MPKIAGEALKKITINCFEADIDYLSRVYGYGWSEQIRVIVNKFCKERRQKEIEMLANMESQNG